MLFSSQGKEWSIMGYMYFSLLENKPTSSSQHIIHTHSLLGALEKLSRWFFGGRNINGIYMWWYFCHFNDLIMWSLIKSLGLKVKLSFYKENSTGHLLTAICKYLKSQKQCNYKVVWKSVCGRSFPQQPFHSMYVLQCDFAP